jgi:inorganic triphosphatase YgiF
MEVEAKLTTARKSVLDDVARLTRLSGFELHALRPLALETVYLDTAREDLVRARVAFRARDTGQGIELTLKESGTQEGVVHRRPERTWHVSRMPAFPFVPRTAELRRALAPWTRGVPLDVLVGTRVTRRPIEVRRPGGRAAVAEIDLDEVRFFTARGHAVSRTRYEVEVELGAAGNDLDLARIVRALRRRYELAPAARSKLEQALRWARHRRPNPAAIRAT